MVYQASGEAGKILRQTKGVCPECLSELEAAIVRTDDQIALRRRCLIHGEIYTAISSNANEYEELFRYYQELNRISGGKRVKRRCTIFYTNRCNLDCPICFMNANFKTNVPDPHNASLKPLLRNKKGAKINIFGGEPTIREDLPEFIKFIRDSGNLSALFTNGIRFSDLEYARMLKKSGLNEVHLQFDGFDNKIDLKFRNADLLNSKLKALGNAMILDIPAVFEVTLDQETNFCEIPRILDYALMHRHIRGICLRSYCALGKRAVGVARLTVDDLVSGVERNSQGIIKAGEIFILQKLVYIMAEWCRFDWCFSHRYMLIYRKKNNAGFLSLGQILNLRRIGPHLDRYLNIRKRNGFLAKTYFIFMIIPNMLNFKGVGIFLHLLKVIITSKLYRALTQSSFGDSFLVIDFEAPCDRFTFDLERICNTEVIAEDLRVYPSFYAASLAKERFYQQHAQNNK